MLLCWHEGQLNYATFDASDGRDGGFAQFDGVMYQLDSVLIYVDTDDIRPSLARAESLGRSTIVPKTEIPGIGWFGIFRRSIRQPRWPLQEPRRGGLTTSPPGPLSYEEGRLQHNDEGGAWAALSGADALQRADVDDDVGEGVEAMDGARRVRTLGRSMPSAVAWLLIRSAEVRWR